MLIPAQYLFGCQTSVPCTIPPFPSQFHPQNQLQTQLVATIDPPSLLQPLQFPGINLQTPGQLIQVLPQLEAVNSVDKDSGGGCGATETSVTIAQVSQPQFPRINDLQTPGQSMQLLAEPQVVNSIDKDARGGCAAIETSVTPAQIQQPNGHDSVPIPEFPETSNSTGSQEIILRWCSERETTSSTSMELADNENTPNQVPEPKKLENCENFAEEPEVKFPMSPEVVYEQEIHVARVLRPDFLIIPKKTISDDFSKGLERTKKPILRISVNKFYGMLKCSTGENSLEEQNRPGESITIKNHVTHKSVTFRLDPSTGDIVEEKHDIVRSPKKNRSRNRRRKPKVHMCATQRTNTKRPIFARQMLFSFSLSLNQEKIPSTLSSFLFLFFRILFV